MTKNTWKKYSWWQWLIFAIGIITILSVLGAIFLAAGAEPSGKYSNDTVPPVSDPQFFTSLSYGLHLPTGEGGTVTPLVNGDAFKKSLMDAIDNAHQSINFSVYIWEKGDFSKEVIDKLAQKQKEGVEVRVLIDSFGNGSFTLGNYQPIVDAGGKVEAFRSLKFGQLTRYGHRDHRRAIVIDGQTGYIGGIAIADKWLGSAQDKEHWRDNMYQVTGPLAKSLQGDFTDLWSGVTGEFLTGSKFFPDDRPQDKTGIKYILASQNPSADVQILSDFINNSIKAAQKSIIIENPYLVPNQQLLDALVNRARSGVDIRIIVPNKLNDSKLDRLASQHYYQTLLDAGVKIYEYQPTFNHTKLMVVDDQWSVIGSPNLNTRSRRLDIENAFGILDNNFASQNKQIFEDDLTHSTEITTDGWRHRSVFHKALEWAATIFEKQI